MTDDSGLPDRSATDLAAAIRAGDCSPVALVEACLDRIEARNDRTNAFVTVPAESARERARAAEAAVERGDDLGPLHGVPVAVKDLLAVADVRTTYGSVPLADHVPDRDDPAVARLRAAGAIVIGKTNTSEFGHVATTANDLFGATRNPHDPSRTAGGSSGGSAAAVADGLVPAGLGTDAGGSVRIPASACGCVGLKPAAGRVPRHTRPDAFADVVPFTDTGPIARTAEDCALLLDVLAGPHPEDPFSLPGREGRFRDVTGGVDDLRVAYSPDLGAFPVDERVLEPVEETIDRLAAAGATVERIAGPLADVWDDASAASLTLFQAKMAGLAATSRAAFGVDLGERRDELSGVLAAMIERGREHGAVDIAEASAARTAAFDAVQSTLAEYDLLACPTLGTLPFDVDSHGPDRIDGEEIDRYTGWYLTQPFNMTGHPAVSVPAGRSEGLPVGLQIAGRRHDEATVLAASAAL